MLTSISNLSSISVISNVHSHENKASAKRFKGLRLNFALIFIIKSILTANDIKTSCIDIVLDTLQHFYFYSYSTLFGCVFNHYQILLYCLACKKTFLLIFLMNWCSHNSLHLLLLITMEILQKLNKSGHFDIWCSYGTFFTLFTLKNKVFISYFQVIKTTFIVFIHFVALLTKIWKCFTSLTHFTPFRAIIVKLFRFFTTLAFFVL